MLGIAREVSVKQLKEKTHRHGPAKGIFEGFDFTNGDDNWGDVGDEAVHGRPSAKEARMDLTREADEDTDVDGRASDGAEGAREILNSPEEKRKRGRQQTKQARPKGLSGEFQSIFREIKELARPVPASPPAAPPPVPNET